MREANVHLTLDEILLVLHPQGGGVDSHSYQAVKSHLAQCAECALVVDRYKGVMAKLNPFNRGSEATIDPGCPHPDIWVQVAAGLLPHDDALDQLKHAALCSSCSIQLKEALEIVGPSAPPEMEIQRALQTSTPARQKSLAAEMAARSRQVRHSETSNPIPFASKPSRAFRLPVWAYGAVAAVVIVGVALAALLGVFGGRESGSTERLLAQAYAQQRTVELRIPGAGYGPVRVERGQKSQMSSPGALLEAEAAIKKGLEQHPDDPNLLRQKAEADLLNWDYQPAIETLGHALRLQPQSPKLLVDLATAHFERAEATDTPADYESALQYLGDALRLSPKDPAALFNRAIIYERLFLYSSAVADWEFLLTIEGDAGWKQEAQKRLNDLRTKQQRHSARDAPEHLSPAEFKSTLDNKITLDPEQYIELAERKILPNISQANQQDQNYQLAVLLAQHFESTHSDRFFTDLLRSSGQPSFHEAAQLLGKASTANAAGHSEDAYADALRSRRLFQQLGNDAGAVASGFEEAYALQFESHADRCQATASESVVSARQRGYTWLEIQSLLEQAICSSMLGDVGNAKDLAKQSLRLAKDREYPSFYLRGLMALATLESEAGDEPSAWAAVREGLDRYWNGNLSSVRAYSFYTLLRLMAQRLGHWNVQFAAAYEALELSASNPNRIVEAAERSRLADAALHLADKKVAEEQFSRAAVLFAAAPQTASVRWRELETRIGLAKAQSLNRSRAQGAFATLLADLPEVKSLSNRYVESEYYTTLGELKINSGEPGEAAQFLAIATQISDDGLKSLSTWQERLTWIAQQRQAYLLMVESLFLAGKQSSALDTWERFLTARPRLLLKNNAAKDLSASHFATRSMVQPLPREALILTYAFLPDGAIIWMHDKQQLHAVFVPIRAADLKRTAENFLAECSRPDSNLAILRSDAQILYGWLIDPVSQWLPENGRLIVEPDGILGILPLEALIDKSGVYIGEQHAITTAPGLIAEVHPGQLPQIQSSDRALVVAAPVNSTGSLGPPPGALAEADKVAEQFTHATTLSGNKARRASVEKEIVRSSIFHFAGHATGGRSGTEMLLADGSLAVAGRLSVYDHRSVPARDSHALSSLKLAVLSACGTAKPSESAQSSGLVAEFLHAGTSNVVASRWNVDSMATTDFMVQFYRSVLSGQPVAVALQTTAGEFRKIPGRAHPYYWAAFSAFSNS